MRVKPLLKHHSMIKVTISEPYLRYSECNRTAPAISSKMAGLKWSQKAISAKRRRKLWKDAKHQRYICFVRVIQVRMIGYVYDKWITWMLWYRQPRSGSIGNHLRRRRQTNSNNNSIKNWEQDQTKILSSITHSCTLHIFNYLLPVNNNEFSRDKYSRYQWRSTQK